MTQQKKLLKPAGRNWFQQFLLNKWKHWQHGCKVALCFCSSVSLPSLLCYPPGGNLRWREAQLIRTDWPHTEVIVVNLVLWAQAENSHLAHWDQRVLLHSGNFPTVPRTLHGTTFFSFSDFSQHKHQECFRPVPTTHTSPFVPLGGFSFLFDEKACRISCAKIHISSAFSFHRCQFWGFFFKNCFFRSQSPPTLPAWGNDTTQTVLRREGQRGCERKGQITRRVWETKSCTTPTKSIRPAWNLWCHSLADHRLITKKHVTFTLMKQWADKKYDRKTSWEAAEWILLIGTVSYSCFCHVWPTDTTAARINTTECHTWTFFSFFY